MKKSLIILVLIFIAFSSNSQQIKNSGYELSSEDYLVKSKKRLETGLGYQVEPLLWSPGEVIH